MDVLHAALWIDDVEATTAFYCDALGLERSREFVGDDGVTNLFLIGESDAELQFKYDDADREIEPAGVDHVAVAAENVDETVERAVANHDSEIVREPTTLDDMGVRIAFVTDPEGYTVELIQQLDG